jgi:hypothetical protein
MFLRDYLDAIFYQQKSDRRKRARVNDNSRFAADETNAPLNASRWTKSGYNGSMKDVIKEVVSKFDDSNRNAADKSEDNQNESDN